MEQQANLFSTNPNLNAYYIKKIFFEKANELGSPLSEVIYEGSNINTFIEVLSYVFTVLSLKIDVVSTEMGVLPELEKNILNRMKVYNFDPQRDISSSISLEVSTSELPLSIPKGTILQVATEDEETKFFHIVENDIIFSNTSEYNKLTFTEGIMHEEEYNVTMNNKDILISDFKWNIEHNNLEVYYNDSLLRQLKNVDSVELTEDLFITEQYYVLDFSDEGGLKIKLFNNLEGTVIVKFLETKGSDGNNISTSNLAFNSDFPSLTIQNENYSTGGLGHIKLPEIKGLMHRINNMQKRIVNANDLATYLSFYFSEWDNRVLRAIDFDENKPLGLIYVNLFQVSLAGEITNINT